MKDGPRELDILGWMGRTALELVGQGGLGHSFDPLIAESRDEYTEAVKAMVYVARLLMLDLSCLSLLPVTQPRVLHDPVGQSVCVEILAVEYKGTTPAV